MAERFAAAAARAVAVELLEQLRPTCIRIEVAGSLRRARPDVKDVELVFEPVLPTTLFGEVDDNAPTAADAVLDRLVQSGRLERRLFDGTQRWGRRYKAAVAVPERIPLDLFIVRPPAVFPVIFAIRTGPAEYSKRLVTECQAHGRRVEGGRLIDRVGTPISTPTERDFIEACGVPWAEPEARA